MARRTCRRRARAVAASAPAAASRRPAGSRSRRPISERRTPRAASPAPWRRRNEPRSDMRPTTSARGRFQLSDEKAKRVSVSTPRAGAASTTRLAARTPERLPASRGRPRAAAHRPLPSMTMATWSACGLSGSKLLCIIEFCPQKKGTRRSPPERAASGADQRLHVVEVTAELAPPDVGQAVLGPRPPALEALGAHDVLGFFELATVGGEIAVRGLEERLELVEAERPCRR